MAGEEETCLRFFQLLDPLRNVYHGLDVSKQPHCITQSDISPPLTMHRTEVSLGHFATPSSRERTPWIKRTDFLKPQARFTQQPGRRYAQWQLLVLLDKKPPQKTRTYRTPTFISLDYTVDCIGSNAAGAAWDSICYRTSKYWTKSRNS